MTRNNRFSFHLEVEQKINVRLGVRFLLASKLLDNSLQGVYKNTWFTLGFQRVGCDVVLCNAEQDGVAVELVELCLKERHREGTCK